MDTSSISEQDWRNIFLRCDAHTLVALDRTCQSFHDILRDQKFWIQKCDYDGTPLPPLSIRKMVLHGLAIPGGASDEPVDFDYRKIALKRPYGINLTEFMRGLTIKELEEYEGIYFHHGGNGFSVEKKPVYAASDPRVDLCLATSYGWCDRIVQINLVDRGVDAWVLDYIRPKITVRELTTCRGDCAATYELHAQLLKNEEEFEMGLELPRCKRETRTWPQWEGGKAWEQVSMEFTEYPIGMRKISIVSRGKDEQFWAGHYGAKFANLDVLVEWPEEPKIYSSEDFPDPPHPPRGQDFTFRALRSLRVPVGLRGRLRNRRYN